MRCCFFTDLDASETILDFFSSLIGQLRIQMGVAAVEHMVRIFLGAFTRDQLTQVLNITL